MSSNNEKPAKIVTSLDLIRLRQLIAVVCIQREMKIPEACHYIVTLLDRATDFKIYNTGVEGLPDFLDPNDGDARSDALMSLLNSRYWDRSGPLPENENDWSKEDRAAEFLAIEQLDAATLLGLSPAQWDELVSRHPALHWRPSHDAARLIMSSTERDCLNRDHAHFSLKLAAAIEAWRAVSTHPEAFRGKSVKQALMEWLRRNAEKFDLIKSDGSPNEQGIEEIAKIANWDTKGGAPKTPGK